MLSASITKCHGIVVWPAAQIQGAQFPGTEMESCHRKSWSPHKGPLETRETWYCLWFTFYHQRLIRDVIMYKKSLKIPKG